MVGADKPLALGVLLAGCLSFCEGGDWISSSVDDVCACDVCVWLFVGACVFVGLGLVIVAVWRFGSTNGCEVNFLKGKFLWSVFMYCHITEERTHRSGGKSHPLPLEWRRSWCKSFIVSRPCLPDLSAHLRFHPFLTLPVFCFSRDSTLMKMAVFSQPELCA